VHPEAHSWVANHATAEAVTVLDIGGRNINGTVRDLFPGAVSYTALDIREGDGVDIVADAATWEPTGLWDVVVCCEVFEHAAQWRDICATTFKALRPGGLFITTMAGTGRPEHSGVDGGPSLWPGEHYGNVAGADLEVRLKECGFADVTVDEQPSPADTRAVATRPQGSV
jgi:SAM-dependent methyltransferase